MSLNRGNNDHLENEEEGRVNRTSEAVAVREFLHRERGEGESSAHHVEEFMRQFSFADIHFMNGLIEIMANHEMSSSSANHSRHENQDQDDCESGQEEPTEDDLPSLAWPEGYQRDSYEDDAFDDVHGNADDYQDEIDEGNDEPMLERPRNATAPRVHLANDVDDNDTIPPLLSQNLINVDASQHDGGSSYDDWPLWIAGNSDVNSNNENSDDDDESMAETPPSPRVDDDDDNESSGDEPAATMGGEVPLVPSQGAFVGESLFRAGQLPQITSLSNEDLFRGTIMQDLRSRLLQRVGGVTFHDSGTMIGIGMNFDSDTESDDGLSVVDQDDDTYSAQAFFRSEHTVRFLEEGHDMYVTTDSNTVEDKGGISDDDEKRQAGHVLPHTNGDPTCYNHEEIRRQVDPGHIVHNRGLSAGDDNNNDDDDMSSDPEMPELIARDNRDNDSSSTDSSMPDLVPRYGSRVPPLIRVHGSNRRSPRLIGYTVEVDIDYDVNLPDRPTLARRQRARHAPDRNRHLEVGIDVAVMPDPSSIGRLPSDAPNDDDDVDSHSSVPPLICQHTAVE